MPRAVVCARIRPLPELWPAYAAARQRWPGGLKTEAKNMRIIKMTKRMLLILTLVVTLGTSAAGQSTDENRPTPVTSNVLTGTAQGSGTYVYSLKSRRGTTVNVRADLTLAGDGSQG